MAVYWIGQNGNAYLKGDDGKVKDLGKNTKDYGTGFDAQFGSAQAKRIDDPNKPVVAQKTLQSSYVAPAKAANFNIQGAYNSAYGQAAANQNALYDKYLNNFLDTQRNAMAKQQNIYQTTNQNLETALKNTQEAGKLKGERTQEDFTQAKDQTNLEADQFQTDSGTQDAITRIEEARAAANSGGTMGGLTGQKLATSQEQRNIGEARQVDKFDKEKYTQELVKARTFEDIAIAGKQAQEQTVAGKKSAQFDLDNYIIQSQIDEKSYRDKDQADRNAAIIEERNRIAKEQYENWLNTLSDPVRIATAAKYVGSF